MPSWSPSYYTLITEPGSGRYGDRLMLCTLHQPPCIRHGRPGEEWCQQLPKHRRPFPAAEAAPQQSAQTITVQLDAAQLGQAVAEGVVTGFRIARAEQRAERRR